MTADMAMENKLGQMVQDSKANGFKGDLKTELMYFLMVQST